MTACKLMHLVPVDILGFRTQAIIQCHAWSHTSRRLTTDAWTTTSPCACIGRTACRQPASSLTYYMRRCPFCPFSPTEPLIVSCLGLRRSARVRCQSSRGPKQRHKKTSVSYCWCRKQLLTWCIMACVSFIICYKGVKEFRWFCAV